MKDRGSMIYTSNYDNAKKGNLISISGDKGNLKDYKGRCCPELAPKMLFWKVWHDNLGKWSLSESEQFFINQYYIQVLKRINFDLLIPTLGEDPILLCYENPNEFCHRFLVASYIEIKYGVKVPELIIDESGNYITTDYKPHYLKDKVLRLVQISER